MKTFFCSVIFGLLISINIPQRSVEARIDLAERCVMFVGSATLVWVWRWETRVKNPFKESASKPPESSPER